MSTQIPAVKLSPKLVFGMLKIVDQNEGNPEKMREDMIKYYRSESIREKTPTPKNIVRAVTLPSLRHLDLIEGYWPRVSINPNGKNILKAYNTHGKSEAIRRFGQILCRIDRKTGSVTELLLSKRNDHNMISFSDVVRSLKAGYGAKSEKEIRVISDRLKRWLQYLKYIGFIELNGSLIKVNRSVILNCQEDKRVEISSKQFVELLRRDYRELVRKEGSVYVPIPKLRDLICDETGMLKDEFYDMLQSIKFATNTYSILLSEPMLREKGGITVGNKYYYYLSIYERQ
jgi:hypothetical protein